MTLPELDPPTLVEDAAGMDRLLADLADHDEIAVDTEADSFFSYREKVCLVQITVAERDYLVDPLAPGVDLARLADVFADPDTTKVLHDCEYDVLILARDHGFRFAGLFDTRVAAATLGTPTPGLASVLEEHFGVVLDKSQQRSNWAKRPLTEDQVRYARLDTHFLLPLAAEQRVALLERDRMVFVEAECRRLERMEPVPNDFQPDDFVRIKGARGLSPSERRVLRELFVLREELAEAADVPPFRVLNNQVLIELARQRPRDERRLAAVHGFSVRMVRRMGDRVLETIERARRLDPIRDLPPQPKKDGTEGMDDQEVELFERLKRWRKDVADELAIESSYLLNRALMSAIARGRPGDAAALAAAGLEPWQVERFGEAVLARVADFERDLAAGEVDPPRAWRRRTRRKGRAR